MPAVERGTVAQTAPRHDAVRVLLRAGKNDEAIVQLCAIMVTRPDDLEAKELLFDAFFQKRDCRCRRSSSWRRHWRRWEQIERETAAGKHLD
jgi:hypothetical protein